jgi:hypothetical protein
MNVIVTNLDGTKTPYSFEPSVAKTIDLVLFYTTMLKDKGILGFTATDNSGFSIAIGSN